MRLPTYRKIKKCRETSIFQKAPEGTRTPDLLITNQLLYQLSHGSTFAECSITIAQTLGFVNGFLKFFQISDQFQLLFEYSVSSNQFCYFQSLLLFANARFRRFYFLYHPFLSGNSTKFIEFLQEKFLVNWQTHSFFKPG